MPIACIANIVTARIVCISRRSIETWAKNRCTQAFATNTNSETSAIHKMHKNTPCRNACRRATTSASQLLYVVASCCSATMRLSYNASAF